MVTVERGRAGKYTLAEPWAPADPNGARPKCVKGHHSSQRGDRNSIAIGDGV